VKETKEVNSEVKKGKLGYYSVKQLNLSQELIDYVLQEEIFTCKEDELGSKYFDRCVDYPSVPKHIYYEGYYHAKNTSKTVKSVHSRKMVEIEK